MKAPRMRKAQFSEQIITKKLLTQFKKKFPEYKDMKWEQFREHWLNIAQTIRQEAIYNPLGVKLGSYTGELKLQLFFKEYPAVNYSTSVELGEEVNHLNLVSKGKRSIIKWERRWAVKFNRILQFFAFTPTRELKALAYKRVTESPEQLRDARSTKGGFSIWRQIKNKL